MQKIPQLKKGDYVELIAPASRFKDHDLAAVKKLLNTWGLNVIVSDTILGHDLLCANDDNARSLAFINAMQNKKTKAVIAIRGGYGSLRLIPTLSKLKPASKKIFIGMSDITALNIFLMKEWHWPVIHSGIDKNKFSKESLSMLKKLLFNEIKKISFIGEPLNQVAKEKKILITSIIGGNLTALQTSIGTRWQLHAKDKIIFLEDIGERAYRIDRMLEHLRQAKMYKQAKAIVFGDFLEGKEPNGTSLINPVIKRFAENCKLPVIKINGVGHGYENYPLPLGTKAKLILGEKIQLNCYR